jgi:hypothetical protein
MTTVTAASYKSPHHYVECDLADGESLLDWRRARHQRRPRPSLLKRLTGNSAT